MPGSRGSSSPTGPRPRQADTAESGIARRAGVPRPLARAGCRLRSCRGGKMRTLFVRRLSQRGRARIGMGGPRDAADAPCVSGADRRAAPGGTGRGRPRRSGRCRGRPARPGRRAGPLCSGAPTRRRTSFVALASAGATRSLLCSRIAARRSWPVWVAGSRASSTRSTRCSNPSTSRPSCARRRQRLCGRGAPSRSHRVMMQRCNGAACGRKIPLHAVFRDCHDNRFTTVWAQCAMCHQIL